MSFPTFLLSLLPKRLRQLTKFTLFVSLGLLLLSAAPAMAQDASGPFSFVSGLQQRLVDLLQWIEGLGIIAPIVFIIAYIIITVAFLPASVVTLGAGAVFGVVQGSIYVFIGAMLGATAAFLVGRFVARDWIAKKVEGNKFFSSLDNAIADEGLKLIFLIRLSPAFPFNLLNYALGLTKVSLPDYVLGTTGIIPGTIMYVYLGSLIKDVATLGAGDAPSNPVVSWIIRILIFVTIVAISLYIAKIAKKALNESVPEAEESQTDMMV